MMYAAVFQMLAIGVLCVVCIKWALDAYKESKEYAERTKKSGWDD